MRKEYRRAIRDLFKGAVARALAGFLPVKLRSPILFGGETVFRWTPGGELQCFVILVPDHRGRQSFTVELAWSTAGRFPDITARPSIVLAPGDPDPVEVLEAVVRLGDLHTRRDLWWDLPDPASENPGDIEALRLSILPIDSSAATRAAKTPVNAAVTILMDSGVPFLETLAERHLGKPASPRFP